MDDFFAGFVIGLAIAAVVVGLVVFGCTANAKNEEWQNKAVHYGAARFVGTEDGSREFHWSNQNSAK